MPLDASKKIKKTKKKESKEKGDDMKKIKRDPYFENILEQAVRSGGPLVVYNDEKGEPKDGLYLLSGNRTMTLAIKEVQRKAAEMEDASEM